MQKWETITVKDRGFGDAFENRANQQIIYRKSLGLQALPLPPKECGSGQRISASAGACVECVVGTFKEGLNNATTCIPCP